MSTTNKRSNKGKTGVDVSDIGTHFEDIEPVSLHELTQSRYLNYAMSVITSRALPDVRLYHGEESHGLLPSVAHGVSRAIPNSARCARRSTPLSGLPSAGQSGHV